MERFFICYWIIFPICLLFSSCGSSYIGVSRSTFDSIDIGTSSKDIIKQYGSPYKIYSIDINRQEYEYVEKISVGREPISETRYIFTLEKGVVISKRSEKSFPPAYNAIYNEDPNNLGS